MTRIALARLRLQWRRFSAIFVCVLVSAGFVAAIGIVQQQGRIRAEEVVGPEYRAADAVVSLVERDAPEETGVGSTVSRRQAEAVARVPGVESVWAQEGLGRDVGRTPDAGPFAEFVPMPSDASLIAQPLAEGRFPRAEDEIVLAAPQAQRLGLRPGDTTDWPFWVWEEHGASRREGTGIRLHVVGVLSEGLPWNLMPRRTLQELSDRQIRDSGLVGGRDSAQIGNLVLRLREGTTPQDVAPGIERAILGAPPALTGTGEPALADPVVGTTSGREALDRRIRRSSAGVRPFDVILWGFAVLALVVAGVVVSTIFSVLAAERTRETSLLRVLGASGGQLLRTAALEAFVLGILASVAGTGLACLACIGLVPLAAEHGLLPGPGTAVEVRPSAVLPGLALGTITTVVAGCLPVLRNRSVPPLAGLRDGGDGRTRRRRHAVFSGSLCLLAGGPVLVIAAVAQDRPAQGILGGALVGLGALLTSWGWFPSAVGLQSRLLGARRRPGSALGLAAAQTARAPGRTANVGAALLIGTLLVATVLSGQHLAKTSLVADLDRTYPDDVVVGRALAQDEQRRVREVDGVLSVRSGSERTVVDTAPDLSGPQARAAADRIGLVVGEPAERIAGGLLAKADRLALLDALLGVVLCLLAASVLVALCGVAATTALSVAERKREHALLRALGADAGRVRRAVLAEAALVGTAAVLSGTVLGWLLGFSVLRAVTTEAIPVAPSVPWQGFALLIAGMVLTALAAAWLPARRAGRISPSAVWRRRRLMRMRTVFVRAAAHATSRPFLLNAMGCVLALVLGRALFGHLDPNPDWFATVVLALPALTRLHRPVGSAVLLIVLTPVCMALGAGPMVSTGVWVAPLMAWTVGRARIRPWTRWVLMGTGLLMAWAVVEMWMQHRYALYSFTTPEGEWIERVPGIAQTAGPCLMASGALAIAFLLGTQGRVRADQQAAVTAEARARAERNEALAQRADALAESNRRLRIEREQEVRLAAQDERARIAREMHDVVAHSLSVVIAQADGARYAATADPHAVTGALERIAETARGSLAEMRGLLGVLRTGEETPAAPVPGLARIPELFDGAEASGTRVRLRTRWPLEAVERSLPQGLSLAFYRLVQEGLTNVVKHAPGAEAVEVLLREASGRLVVSVASDGLGTAPPREHPGRIPGTGQGINGLEERFAGWGGNRRGGNLAPPPGSVGADRFGAPARGSARVLGDAGARFRRCRRGVDGRSGPGTGGRAQVLSG